LLNVNGSFYGVTYSGGHRGHHCLVSNGCGTVFSITPSGKEDVIYSFKGRRGCGDGAFPATNLLDINGTLYGTTTQGGGASQSYSMFGTVFSVTTGGQETILHSFTGGVDGAEPAGWLST
jgi:uncharacterized repeat protein (TIGR03803 family)